MILTDLKKLVVEADRVSAARAADKWQAVEYETGDFKGVMLVAAELSFPAPVTLRLNAKGRYKIWLGFIHYCGSASAHTAVRLSDDDAPSILQPDPYQKQVVDGYNYWAPYSWIEEGFWKCADLDGQDLILEKPSVIAQGCTSQLCLIRLEKMTKEEIIAERAPVSDTQKNMMYHFDTDYLFWYYDYKEPAEYGNAIERFEKSTGEIIVQETYFEDFEPIGQEGPEAKMSRKNYRQNFRKYLDRQDEIAALLVERAHAAGMKLYAGTRTEMGNFLPPLDTPLLSKKFVAEHPEFSIFTRDGRRTDILSYAYPEVRDWEIERLMRSVRRGYDGVSVFFIRGIFVGFEKPVRDLFCERYGSNIDPARVPLSDARLNGCMCEFITLFLEGLRQRLDDYSRTAGRERIPVNVIVGYSAAASRLVGCDVETWLSRGLVDSVSQGLMMCYEDLEGCMSEEDPSLIDPGKYEQALKRRAIFRRAYHDREETVVEGAKELLSLTERYHKDFYAALPWENKSAVYHAELAQKLYRAGVRKLISWNANHIAENLPKLNTVKILGDRERVLSSEPEKLGGRTLYRVLSIGGKDISTYNPSWLG